MPNLNFFNGVIKVDKDEDPLIFESMKLLSDKSKPIPKPTTSEKITIEQAIETLQKAFKDDKYRELWEGTLAGCFVDAFKSRTCYQDELAFTIESGFLQTIAQQAATKFIILLNKKLLPEQ